MPTKQEIADAIKRSQERVFATFGALSEEQLATRVHDDEGDQWTAKQVLAHLAGRRDGYQLMLGMARPGAEPPDFGSFDLDGWNRRQVEPRMDKNVAELLEEFGQVHDELAQQIEAMPGEMLGTEVQMPRGSVKLGDLLLGSGAMHSVAHAEVVEGVLGL